MVKKIFVGIVITAVFGALILGGVNRALAKNDFSRTNAGDPVLLNDNADAPSGIHEETMVSMKTRFAIKNKKWYRNSINTNIRMNTNTQLSRVLKVVIQAKTQG